MSDFFTDARRAFHELLDATRGRRTEPATERSVAIALALAALAFASDPVRARFGAKAGEALLKVAVTLWSQRPEREHGYSRYDNY